MAALVGTGQIRGDALRVFQRARDGERIQIVRRGKVTAHIVAPGGEDAPPPPPAPTPLGTLAVGITELRDRAGHYLDRVAEGETLEVRRRGRILGWVVAKRSD